MNRYKITTQTNQTLILYYNDLNTAQIINPNCVIEPYTDLSHEKYCKTIIDTAQDIKYDYKGRKLYIFNNNHQTIYIRLYYDESDNTFYDYCEYQVVNKGDFVLPVTFTMSEPQKAYELLVGNATFELLQFRKYGEQKLIKPKELKGIKGISVDFIPKKCKCEFFVKDNNIYIKHRDYFSPSYHRPEDIGTPLEYRIKKYGINSKKSSGFVYNDCWGDIVLRQEAWIKYNNIINVKNKAKLMEKLLCDYHRLDGLDTYWRNMFESIENHLTN